MNNQEAIKELTSIANGTGWVTHKSACNVVSQINEPQKVVIPKFVAEIIEYHKGINGLLKDVYAEGEAYRSEFEEWLLEVDNAHDIVARAWLDGYEIEQLFTVDIPNPVLTDNSDSVTVLMKEDFGVVLTDVVDYI